MPVIWFKAKRYDVQECALRVVSLVNLKFKDCFSINASVDIHIGRVHFLLRFFSPSQIHLRFKTEKPSQLLLKCEKVCILKSP